MLTNRFITEKAVLGVLIAGFSLVTVLLLVAGVIGVRSASELQQSAQDLVEARVATSELVHEIQVEQQTLNRVMYRLSRTPETVDRERLIEQLDAADREVVRIVAAATGTPREKLWRQVGDAAQGFSEEARRVLDQIGTSNSSLRTLFARHDDVLQAVAALVAESTRSTRELENEIDRRASELIRHSGTLLGACLLLAMVCAVLTIVVTKESIRKIEWQAGELSRVSWHMVESQEAAARRFSHELHDELGQSLAAVKANVSTVTRDTFDARQSDTLGLVDQAISNVRELAQLLRPVILDDFGLDASLRWLGERFMHRTGIHVDFRSTLLSRLSDETETHLFRIAQEALTNVARHSGARHVTIQLDKADDTVSLAISDDGRGLPADQRSKGLGLVGMQARARHLGGELSLESADGRGLTIRVRAPLKVAGDDVRQEDLHPVGR